MAKAGPASPGSPIRPAGLWRAPLGGRRDRQRLGRRLRPALAALLRTRRGRRLLLGGSFASPELISATEARALVDGYLDGISYVDADREMRATVFEHTGQIDVPVTIVWGERDRGVGRPSRSRRPPGARYLEIAGWGHIPMWDDPEGVAQLLLEASAAGAER